MIDMLQAAFFTTAETTLNQLLRRDHVTLQHLARLEGKVIALNISQPDINLYLLPNCDGLQIQSVYQDQPDCTLSGSLSEFIQLATTPDKRDAMFGKTITISGDSALASRFQEIISDARIDFEEILADIIGDLPAHQIALYTAWKAQWYRSSANSLLHNLDEYMKEEARLIPTRPEADHFYNEIEKLKEDAERLAARFSLLKQKLEG